MDGATVLILALAVGFVLVVVFFVLEARKHAGKTDNTDLSNPSISRRR